MVWTALALMTVGAVLSIVWPLVRPRHAASPLPTDVAFYREQIAELEDDIARGMVGGGDAASTRAELGRRLLAASERVDAARTLGRPRYLAALLVLCLMPVAALGLYLKIGRPTYGDDPLAARAAPAQDVAALVQRVEAHLAASPDDARGYDLIAPVYMRMGRYEAAARAYGEVLRISGTTPERQAAYGQALVLAADGVVTQQARDAFEAALKASPALPEARFFIGLAAAQDGDKARARDIWGKLVAEAPPGAPWADVVRRRLASLDGAPAPVEGAGAELSTGSAAADIAAMPPGERDAAIRGMVDGLAARLAQDGRDPEGWLRLVRAYKVLGDIDKARAALGGARRSLSGDAGSLARLDALAHELALGD